MNAIDTQRIADFLSTHNLASGLGTAEKPCSVAAINLALTGRLTDAIPECMSPVIGRWIIRIQDNMPDSIRNSSQWKALLPLAAGTGRDAALERRRAALLLDWMWGDVLPQLQPIADARGFGEPWRTMLTKRTAEAAAAAWSAEAAAAPAREAAEAAEAAAWAAAWAAARAAAWSAEAAARAAAWSADATAATAGAWAAREAAADFWDAVDPVAVLARLVAVRGVQP